MKKSTKVDLEWLRKWEAEAQFASAREISETFGLIAPATLHEYAVRRDKGETGVPGPAGHVTISKRRRMWLRSAVADWVREQLNRNAN